MNISGGNKGKLIVFEGVEGSGKTTMVDKTYNYLKSKGVDCIKSREPGGTLCGNDIREIIFGKEYSPLLDEQTKLYLMEAARREHYLHIIKPALDAGKVVLLDRFVMCTVVYQNEALGTNEITRLNDFATDCVDIDATLIFDMDAQIAYDRTHSGDRVDHNYHDDRSLKWYKDTNTLYKFIAISEDNKYKPKVVNANRSIDEVFKDVIDIVEGVIDND